MMPDSSFKLFEANKYFVTKVRGLAVTCKRRVVTPACVLQALESYTDLTLIDAIIMCLTRLQPLLRQVAPSPTLSQPLVGSSVLTCPNSLPPLSRPLVGSSVLTCPNSLPPLSRPLVGSSVLTCPNSPTAQSASCRQQRPNLS